MAGKREVKKSRMFKINDQATIHKPSFKECVHPVKKFDWNWKAFRGLVKSWHRRDRLDDSTD